MTRLALTPDDRRHTALINEIATVIDGVLIEHEWTVHAGVLATLLARFLVGVPPELRSAIVVEHLKLAKGLVELFDLQTADRQAN